jgi:autotransporter-associated beta strand protein
MKPTTPSFPKMWCQFTRFIAIAAVCLLGYKLPSSAQMVDIPIPNYSFDTSGPNFSGSSYADQTTIGWGYDSLPYGTGVGEPYDGWLTAAANYQIYSVSTSGDTGAFDGANAVQVNGYSNYGYTLESLTPVVTSIANNAIYTLTFALANDGGGAGNVTLSMLSTTSAPNTFDYSSTPVGNNPALGYYPATSPYPIITTVKTLASTTVSGSTINAQTVGDFTDYHVTFSTVDGLNASFVGQDLTLALNVSNNSSLQFDNAQLTKTTPLPAPPPLNLYYDTNGISSGTSTTGSSNLTDSVWTTSSAGTSTPGGFVGGSNIIFSAGTNGTGAQNVTVTDSESVNGITVNNGTVTLVGSGNPSLSIGNGGINNNSTDGATTLDSSLGTVQVTSGLGQWNNDSSQALNINSGVNSAGGTITFDGTGNGNVNINGQITGGLDLTDDSTHSTLYLNSESNSFSGTITVNGGTLVYQNQGSLANNNITLENGGALESDTDVFSTGNDLLSNDITLGPGGGAVGDIGTSGNDMVFSGTFTGGTGLSIINGDFITQNDGTSNVGTLNINGGRLLAGSAGIFGNNALVNVSSVLDFGWNGYAGTLGNTISLENGGAIENRNGGTMNLTDVVFPTGGNEIVTLGADDVGNGSLDLNGPNINLANGTTLTVDLNENHPNGYWDTNVSLNEAITGSGALDLNLIPGSNNSRTGVLYLNGNNNYSGPTTLNGGVTVGLAPTGFSTSAVTSNGANIYVTSGGTMANNFTINQTTGIAFTSGSSDLNLTGAIELAGTQESLNIGNQTGSKLNVDSITFDKVVGNSYYANFDASGTGGIYLTGTYTSPYYTTDQTTSNYGPPSNGGYGPSSLQFGGGGEENANYYLTSSANFTNMAPVTGNGRGSVDGTPGIDLDSGNLYIDNSSWVPGQQMAVQDPGYSNHTVDIVGSQDINLGVYVGLYNFYGPNAGGFTPWAISQTTADSSTWAGPIQLNGSPLTISAVAGSRLTFAGDLGGGGPETITKTGAGTVVFGDANGNDLQSTGGVIADIQQGTLLVNSKPGAGYGLGPNNGTINIEAGATFGGTTTLYGGQQVVAEDPTAIISPGDAGQANLGIKAKIGTLTLPGIPSGTPGQAQSDGLVAADGLTMDFKLGSTLATPRLHPGVDNDFISLGGMELTGTVTINLSALGNPLLGLANYYILFQGTGDTRWTGAPPTFVINTPTGYYLNPAFGTSDGLGDGKRLGYIYNPVANYFYVDLIPEPSTYGLLGLGLLALVVTGRFRRLARAE